MTGIGPAIRILGMGQCERTLDGFDDFTQADLLWRSSQHIAPARTPLSGYPGWIGPRRFGPVRAPAPLRVGDRDLWRDRIDSFYYQRLVQLAAREHLLHDVAAAQEFAVQVQPLLVCHGPGDFGDF